MVIFAITTQLCFWLLTSNQQSSVLHITRIYVTFAIQGAGGPPVGCSCSDQEAPPPFSNMQSHSYEVQLKNDKKDREIFKDCNTRMSC